MELQTAKVENKQTVFFIQWQTSNVGNAMLSHSRELCQAQTCLLLALIVE
jgi:hypothetical protein